MQQSQLQNSQVDSSFTAHANPTSASNNQQSNPVSNAKNMVGSSGVAGADSTVTQPNHPLVPTITSPITLRVGIMRFPGTCDDRDAAYALQSVGLEPVMLWHQSSDLQGVDAVIVPGGFSYGDYLRCGAVARFSQGMQAIVEFANAGGRVLGICNGFQILTEAGLLPGALTRNIGVRFRHTVIHVKDNAGRVYRLPLKSGEGRYVHDNIEQLQANGQIWVQYSKPDGTVSAKANPNGAYHNIAGVKNEAGNVAGLMPHPEHAVDGLVGIHSTDGRTLLLSHLLADQQSFSEHIRSELAKQ